MDNLLLGMTTKEVYDITGDAWKMLIDHWTFETGPDYRYIIWSYIKHGERFDPNYKNANIAIPNDPYRKSFLYFKEDLLAGWYIYKDVELSVFIGDIDPSYNNYIVKLYDIPSEVIKRYGTPSKLYPSGWKDTNNKERWTYTDIYSNDLLYIEFIDNKVIKIVIL